MIAAVTPIRKFRHRPRFEAKLLGNLTKTYTVPRGLKVLRGRHQPTVGQCCMRVPTPKHGDKRLTWNKRNPRECREAKKMFMQFVKDGLVPHWVAPTGEKSGKVMRRFDRRAEEIVFAPLRLLRGG